MVHQGGGPNCIFLVRDLSCVLYSSTILAILCLARSLQFTWFQCHRQTEPQNHIQSNIASHCLNQLGLQYHYTTFNTPTLTYTTLYHPKVPYSTIITITTLQNTIILFIQLPYTLQHYTILHYTFKHHPWVGFGLGVFWKA